MTRQEFIDDVTTWSELIQFCYDEGCDIYEDIYNDYQKDEYYNDRLNDMCSECEDWQDLYRMLEDIPTGYDYYIRDEYDYELRGADNDDFDDYKDEVMEYCDNDGGIWDEEEYEYEDEYEEDETDPFVGEPEDVDEEIVESSSFSVGELFATCKSNFQVIKQEDDQKKAEDYFDLTPLF